MLTFFPCGSLETRRHPVRSGNPPPYSMSATLLTALGYDSSTMACNMLSYVEHYEPSYFLLENVVGFLAHKFYADRETAGGTVETVIQAGMVKLVVRTLIALGYQVRFKVLQAAQYGVPQSRRRVIFWGAKRGVPLPDFPVPVYAHEKGMHLVHLPTGKSLNPPTRSKDPGESAPVCATPANHGGCLHWGSGKHNVLVPDAAKTSNCHSFFSGT